MKETVSRHATNSASNPEQISSASRHYFHIAVIWVSAALLICAVVAFSYLQLKNIQAQQRSGVNGMLASLARVSEEHALRTFRAADQSLRFMMARYAAEGNKLDLKAMVHQGVIDSSLFAQLGIIDARGIFQLSNIPFKKGLNLSDREHFRVHITADTGELFVSKPVLGRASGKWSIQLTRRINLPDGSFGGVAVVSIDTDYFARFYSDLNLPPQSVAILIGLDGVIRTRQVDGQASLGRLMSQSPILQLIGEGKVNGAYTGRSPVDGVERVYTYRKIAGYPLVVITGMATNALLAMSTPSRNALIVQTTALCLLLLAGATGLSFYTLRLYRELTQRRRMATELRDSQEHLELALNGGALGAWDWNLREEKFTSNVQLPELIGFQAGEISYGKDAFVSLMHSDDLSAFTAALRQHLKAETEYFQSEFRLRHKSGDWVWINLMSKVMERDADGRAVRLSGTAQDVTAKMNAVQALTESEDRWNRAITGSNEGIWDWNVMTGNMYVSGRLLVLLEYESDKPDITLQDWISYVHPNDMDEAHQALLLHFKGQSDFYRIEIRLRCKDGHYKWMLIRGRASRDQEGRVVRVTGSASDITEQRFSQAQVEDRTQQLDAIFSLSPDAFISFDRELRVKYVNPAFERLIGLSSGAVIGLSEDEFVKKINELCTTSRCMPDMTTLRKPRTQADEEHTRIELKPPSRRVLYVNLMTSEADSVSQILYLRDVTYETLVEEMKTEFLSTAAHELRTPMAGILGFSEVLLSQKLNEAEQKEFLNIILTQSRRMTEILNELLDLARIESRKGMDFVIEKLNLQQLVEEIVSEFIPPAGRTAPQVESSVAYCMADQGKARQAILNVLSNAYKYSPPGTDVRIVLSPPPATNSHSFVGISIQDQGIGMTEEQLERVFERFYRADTSGKVQGTGLGMSITKEIMDIHRGKVEISSILGKGTLVTLFFPAANDPGSENSAGEASWQSLSRETRRTA